MPEPFLDYSLESNVGCKDAYPYRARHYKINNENSAENNYADLVYPSVLSISSSLQILLPVEQRTMGTSLQSTQLTKSSRLGFQDVLPSPDVDSSGHVKTDRLEQKVVGLENMGLETDTYTPTEEGNVTTNWRAKFKEIRNWIVWAFVRNAHQSKGYEFFH